MLAGVWFPIGIVCQFDNIHCGNIDVFIVIMDCFDWFCSSFSLWNCVRKHLRRNLCLLKLWIEFCGDTFIYQLSCRVDIWCNFTTNKTLFNNQCKLNNTQVSELVKIFWICSKLCRNTLKVEVAVVYG